MADEIKVVDSSKKRAASPTRDDEYAKVTKIVEVEEDEMVGPSLSESAEAVNGGKKKKFVEFESVYINNLPSSEAYEKSYMHRELITHLIVCPKTDFIITASSDGSMKFWKKLPVGIEFVKHFRSHIGNIQCICSNSTGTLLASVSNDKSMKIFDVVNFDMISMMKLDYVPGKCEWIHKTGDPISAIAVSDSTTPLIYIYDAKGDGGALHVLERLHQVPVVVMRFNHIHSIMLSVDRDGMMEYWSSAQHDYAFPEHVVSFDSKLDTDLYEFAKHKVIVHDIAFSENGAVFATISSDRKVRVFKFHAAKIIRVFDESLQQLLSLQQMKRLLSNMEFGRRMAMEKELEKSESFSRQSISFDSSGFFILYPTMIGVKVVNWYTNRCVAILGKPENLRPLTVGLYQGIPNQSSASLSVEMRASDNPGLEGHHQQDPMMFCTSFKKNRFYLFSKRDPESSDGELQQQGGQQQAPAERDIFNEKPSREDIVASTEAPAQKRIYETCVMHTSQGDIHCKLFAQECPKTVENFCVHAKEGYFNGHIFHRVIKQFMIQTGDPTGTGTGGESIWGGEFADEFHPNLKHDKPYCLSMANAGKNTNGSQFFVTVVPCPWLDNKHTIFGRVMKGMETVQNISNVKTHPKTDKPYDDVKIVNISLK